MAGRATGLLSGHHTTYSLFDMIPAYQALKARDLSDAELADALRDPAVPTPIVAWEPTVPAAPSAMAEGLRTTFVLGAPPDYEPGPERSLASLAAAAGRHPLEVAYEAMARGRRARAAVLPHPQLLLGDLEPGARCCCTPGPPGLADGGAHCGAICDAPAHLHAELLDPGPHPGEKLPLEWVVRKQTRDTARLYGLGDRGTLEPGMLADLNVIDYERLQLGTP